MRRVLHIRGIWLCSVWLLTLYGSVWCQASDQKEKQFKAMPWHLIDVWWDLGQDRPFESYSIDVTISHDLPASQRIYIAPIGLGHLSKIPFYGGIQTQSDGYTAADSRLRKIGHGLLMSMWGERRIEAIRPAEGGYLQSSGHEGDFVSVRRPYPWTKGKYTYRIVRMDSEDDGSNKSTWVGAFLYSHQKDENIFIGALRFKARDLILSRQIASFVEVYGPRIDPATIPAFTVTFENLQVNNQTVTPVRVTAVYPEGVPDYAQGEFGKGKLVIEVGRKVSRDRRKQEWNSNGQTP